jgi:hypothetical protein
MNEIQKTPLPYTVRDNAREWVRANYGKSARHLLVAEAWLLCLKPDASEEMLIATLTHDMERAFPGEDSPKADPRDGVDDPAYNVAHSERSARIVGAYLREQGVTDEHINEIAQFIKQHEYGGTEDENMVQAADSLSFLDVNIDYFLGMIGAKEKPWSAQAVRSKFDWMYERIQVPRAKAWAQPMYEEAIDKLENTIQHEINKEIPHTL